MKNYTVIPLFILLFLLFSYDLPYVSASDSSLSILNKSGERVTENQLINFEGFTKMPTGQHVYLTYEVSSANGSVVDSGYLKDYNSQGKNIYYGYNIPVTTDVFYDRGFYNIETQLRRADQSIVDVAYFQIYVDVKDRPSKPIISASPATAIQTDTVTVTITPAPNEDPKFLPTTIKYRTSSGGEWQTYSNPLTIEDNNTFIYAVTCSQDDICSSENSLLINNIIEEEVAVGEVTVPTVYKDESRVNTYYVNFKRDDSTITTVPFPSGTFD